MSKRVQDYDKMIKKAEKKKSLNKIRAGIVFGCFGLTLAVALFAIMIMFVVSMVQEQTYPESILLDTQGEVNCYTFDELSQVVNVVGTNYYICMPGNGVIETADNYIKITEGEVSYILYIPEESDQLGVLISGVLSGLGASFYREGDSVEYEAAITDYGFLNGYEMNYVTGHGNVKTMGYNVNVYNASYEIFINDDTVNSFILCVSSQNRDELADAKSVMDQMVFTIKYVDDLEIEDAADDVVIEDVADNDVVENSEVIVPIIIGNPWYTPVNAEDSRELWYDVVIPDENMGQDVYIVSSVIGLINYEKMVLVNTTEGSEHYGEVIEVSPKEGNLMESYWLVDGTDSNYRIEMISDIEDSMNVQIFIRTETQFLYGDYYNAETGDTVGHEFYE